MVQSRSSRKGTSKLLHEAIRRAARVGSRKTVNSTLNPGRKFLKKPDGGMDFDRLEAGSVGAPALPLPDNYGTVRSL
jgi:hypothetical protein